MFTASAYKQKNIFYLNLERRQLTDNRQTVYFCHRKHMFYQLFKTCHFWRWRWYQDKIILPILWCALPVVDKPTA